MVLEVYGAHRVMENAAVALALADAGSGLRDGYIAHLVGGGPDLSADSPEAVADVGMNADTQLLRYSLAHPNLRLIFTATRGHYEILARRSAGIRRPADLRGRRIGTFGRTSSEYYLAQEMRQYGIRARDFELVPLMPEMAVADALIDGDVDAMTIWEPAMRYAKDALGDKVVSFRRAGSYYLRLNANTTAEKLADPAKRAEIVEFIRRVIVASAELREEPARGATLAARLSGFDPELVLRSFSAIEFVAHVEDDALDVLVEQERWLAAEQGREPRDREELGTLIDTSVYEEALALV